jgi:hypothetical protein
MEKKNGCKLLKAVNMAGLPGIFSASCIIRGNHTETKLNKQTGASSGKYQKHK